MSDVTEGQKDPILTLEPLLEAVREGLEDQGWSLSGLQKTTSHEFEGRWAGESSRSAYLFFHRDDVPEGVSIDVFLDETSRGLRGNLALVVDGPELRELDRVPALLGSLAGAAGEALPEGYRRPITFRVRLSGPDRDPDEAVSEARFKIHIPKTALQAGPSAASALAAAAADAFLSLLNHPALGPLLAD